MDPLDKIFSRGIFMSLGVEDKKKMCYTFSEMLEPEALSKDLTELWKKVRKNQMYCYN